MRLIDADALKKEFCKDIMGGLNWESIIDNAPTVEPKQGDLISREALRKDIEHLYSVYKENKEWFYTDVLNHIDNAPTVTDHSLDIAQKSIELGRSLGRTEERAESKRPEGEWEDYSVDFWKCPECGYLLDKYCPQCYNKVILPKGGSET